MTSLAFHYVFAQNSECRFHHFHASLRHPVVAENDILLSEEFVKGGCPSHLRGRLWKQVLLSHVGDKVNKNIHFFLLHLFFFVCS